MAKYDVCVRVIEVGCYKGIEANSKEEAEEIADMMFSNGDTSWETIEPYNDVTFTAKEY